MRTLVLLGAAAALVISQTPAQASPQCNGCNVVHEGTFSAGLAGRTVYHGTSPVTVSSVDVRQQRVYWRDASGTMWWDDADNFYSPQARSERNSNYVAGAIAVGVIGLLLGGRGSGSGGASADDYRRNQDYETARLQQWRQNNLDQGLNENGTVR